MPVSLSSYWNLLATYLRPLRGRVFLLGLLLFGGIGLQLLAPQLMRRIIDAALAGTAVGALHRLALLLIAVAVAQQALSVGAAYLSESVGWTATNRLRDRLAHHVLHLDMGFHNAHTPGEMIERIDGDVTALSNFFSAFIVQIVGNLLLLAGVLLLLAREDWRVGAVMALATLGALLVGVALRRAAVARWREARQASADYFGFLEERLAGTEEIRANGARPFVMRQFFARMRAYTWTEIKAEMVAYTLLNGSWLFFDVGSSAALIGGALLYRAGSVTIGTVYLIFHYSRMINMPIDRLITELEDLQKAGAGVARIQAWLRRRPRLAQISDVAAVAPLRAGPPAIHFQNVSFAYPGDGETAAFALHDVTFRVAPGRVLGLLGRTGSGKTTLTRLLFRLYDPQAGVICLDDNDVRQRPLPELRRQVGMVTQNARLFRATVRDNLTFFRASVDDETIAHALQSLGLGPWLAAQAHGLDTLLAAGGENLSAGEAQLLALARVFLADPQVVVLDEASSRLDPATEKLLQQAMARLLHGRTAIIIAHRLHTLHRADDILILEDGRVLEHGARRALARDPTSRFYQLLQTGMEAVLR